MVALILRTCIALVCALNLLFRFFLIFIYLFLFYHTSIDGNLSTLLPIILCYQVIEIVIMYLLW